MHSSIHWIVGARPWQLATMARPRSGDWLADEITAWRDAGLDAVVSLLEPDEIAELGLRDEATLCLRMGIEPLSFPLPDHDVPPSFHEVHAFAARLAERCAAGEAIAIHCRAGIGRASLIAGAALMIGGMTAEQALAAIGEARGLQVPDTLAQQRWLEDFEIRARSL